MKQHWSFMTALSLGLSTIAVIGVVTLALVSCATPGASPPVVSQSSAPAAVPGGNLMDLQTSFRTISQTVSPSVVRIDVRERITQGGAPDGMPFFDFFFGRPDDEEPDGGEFERGGIGSGVVVTKTGNEYYVLTNDHVVGEADTITVVLDDGTEFTAELVGRDARKDLAMVSFRSQLEIPVARLGNSDSLQVGDWVMAIGSPFGYQNTVTVGIVSALERRGGPDGNISDFIQTDASINQGNSGGALVNLDGEVVGINTWITSDSGGSIGLGFAIPINNAVRSINEFLEDGEVEYGWLGVTIGDVEREQIEPFGLPNARGALVNSVFTGSPADDGGLLPGDVIVELNGRPVRDASELILLVGELPVGEKVPFVLYRQGEEISLTVEIGERATEASLRQLNRQRWPGLSVFPLTEEITDELGLGRERGVIVSSVDQGSPADIGGVRSFDVITAVNGTDIDDLLSFYEIVANPETKDWQLTLIREGEELQLTVVR
jgi:Do/DeqQ family serine protease